MRYKNKENTMFKWKKKGQIWAPSLQNEWAKEYGQNPNALILMIEQNLFFE